jgi:hypothetical protein
LKHEYVVITKKGLEQFEEVLESRENNYFRNKKLPREELAYDAHLSPQQRRKEKKFDRFNDGIIKEILENEDTEFEADERPLKLVTKSLDGYVQDLKAF